MPDTQAAFFGADTVGRRPLEIPALTAAQRVSMSILLGLVLLSAGHKKILLYSVPGKEGFYRKLGFLRLLTAMAIFEDPAKAIARGHLSES